MARMSLAADRPLNWNVLFVSAANDGHGRAQPRRVRLRRANAAPGPRADDARCAVAAHLLRQRLPARHDPRVGRSRWRSRTTRRRRCSRAPKGAPRCVEAAGDGKGLVGIANWPIYVINETFAPENQQFEGRSVGDIAKDQGKDPLDALLDIVVADDLMTGFGFPRGPENDEDWQARVQMWRDPRTIVGASDAGAHLDFLATFNYSTAMLGKAVRERQMLPLEEAIHMLTDVPARLYGLTGTRVASRRLAGRRRRARSRPRSARSKCGCASTSRRARRGCSAVPTASSACSSTDKRSSTTASSPTRGRARCCGRAATPRPSPRHSAPRNAWPRRGASSDGSGGAVARSRPSLSIDVAPDLPERDEQRVRALDHQRPRRHDTMTTRAEAGAIADAYLTLDDTGESASSACSRATSGSIPTRWRTRPRRCVRRDPARTSCGRARPPRRAHAAGGPAAPPVHRPRRWREAARRPPRRPAAIRRRRPGARRRSTSSSTNISSRCSTSACSRCSGSPGTRPPRCSRSSSPTKPCTRSTRGPT